MRQPRHFVPDRCYHLISHVEALIGHCRFSDFQHVTEPGGTIKAALANGMLDPARWEAYVRLKVESAGGEIARVASAHRYRK